MISIKRSFLPYNTPNFLSADLSEKALQSIFFCHKLSTITQKRNQESDNHIQSPQPEEQMIPNNLYSIMYSLKSSITTNHLNHSRSKNDIREGNDNNSYHRHKDFKFQAKVIVWKIENNHRMYNCKITT